MLKVRIFDWNWNANFSWKMNVLMFLHEFSLKNTYQSKSKTKKFSFNSIKKINFKTKKRRESGENRFIENSWNIYNSK